MSCLFLTLIISINATSQTPAFKNYNESNGLPSNESYYVFQDYKGFIWITTDNGVVRFDGLDFTLFNKQNGLADNVNFEIYSDSKNRLWFRSYSGALSIYEEGKLSAYKLNSVIQNYLGKSIMFSLSIDEYDSLHVPLWSRILDADSTGNYKVRSIPDYTLLIQNIKGADPIVLSNNAIHRLRKLVVDGSTQDMIEYDREVSSGNIGAKNFKGKTYFFSDRYLFEVSEEGKRFKLKTDTPIISLSIDNDAGIWIGLQAGGLIYYDGDKFYEPKELVDLKAFSITSVLRDYNGGLWVSTLEKGVYYFPDLSILNFPLPSDSKVSTVAFDGDDVFIGSYDGNLFKFCLADHSYKHIDQFDGSVSGIYCLPQNTGLFVSVPSGTYKLDLLKNKKKMFLDPLGNSLGGIKKFQLINSQIVGCSSNGMLYFNEQANYLRIAATIFKPRSFLFHEGNLFIATISGLIRTNESLTKIDTFKSLINSRVFDLEKTPTGMLVATGERGLLKLTDNTVMPYFQNELCPLVRDIFSDDKKLYLATECGLIIKKINGENQENATLFNSDNGLPETSTNFLGIVGTSLICFTNKGISVIDTTNLLATNKIQFYLKNVRINNEKVTSIPALTFRENNIEFEYGFISFNNRNIQVRHRPSPEFDWSSGDVSKVNYFSLSPGLYHPEIEYSVNNGPWQNVKLSSPFTINPAWWESIYFLIVAALLIALIVGLWIYAFFQRKVAKLKYQEILREEKDRISRELHDNIGSRLAYIKLSLHNLNATSSFGKKEQIVDQLNAVANDLRDTIWTINKDSVSLFDFADRVKSLTTRFQLLNFNIRFNFENEQPFINPQLNSSSVFNMYRIIQEGLNNCIKHSGAESIDVHMKFDKFNKLNIHIKDNGIGFYVDEVNNIDGYGLLSVKARADEMKAQLDINSQPDVGTEIKLVYSIL